MRNRFIVGAGNDLGNYTYGINGIGSGFYRPGQVGGEDTHILTINEMPSHRHVSVEYNNGTFSINDVGSGLKVNGEHIESHYGSSKQNLTGLSGNNFPNENRPPFYSLAYIIKV